MQLPCERERLAHLDEERLRGAILVRRKAIRAHRDAKGDDRCWLDDYFVWDMLEGSPEVPTAPLNILEGMGECTLFYTLRRAETPDPFPADAILDKFKWNADVTAMGRQELLAELVRVQEAIRRHRDMRRERPLRADDDRALYAVMPEKVPADFRLPPEDEFLGEKLAPRAGCPAFWRSHGNCRGPCDLHKWGPCIPPAA